MTAESQDRMLELEKSRRDLEKYPYIKGGKVFNITFAFGVLFFMGIIAILPFPGDPRFWGRVGIGLLSGYAGMGLYFVALYLIREHLKMLVEILAVFIMLMNALAAALLGLFAKPSVQFLEQAEIIEPSGSGAAVVALIVAGVALLLIWNLTVLLGLYPVARTVGASLE